MSDHIAQLLASVKPDPWRADAGFSPDMQAANQRLFNPAASEQDLVAGLSEWLQHHQPCLFGRMATKAGLLSYSILTEADLNSPDEAIRDKIQQARLAWTRGGLKAKKSGFIILAISERLANALPDDRVKALALRLCSLYLLDEVVADKVFLDNIWLEIPGRDAMIWEWRAGVNYFCAQGDKRWWQDHRFPGGMAFSINSVGHLAKASILAGGMAELEKSLGLTEGEWIPSKVDSLDKALEWAMRTIAKAADTPWGRATELLPIPRDADGSPVAKCPAPLPTFLADRNSTEYRGYYHTDFTIPSEYFVPDVARPNGLSGHLLDFTYLFRDDVENPAFCTMGEGRRIQEDKEATSAPAGMFSRRLKMEGRVVPIGANERLREALDR